MGNKINITVVSGSSRINNNTLRVAKAIEKVLKTLEEVESIYFIDFIKNDFPSVGRMDVDRNNLTTFQSHLIDSFKHSQLILICAPEYNWNTNPELINVFHQIGKKDFKDCFENKVFATVGVSSGRGGRRTAIELHILLNKIISFMDAYGMVSPLLFESHETDKNVDTGGNLLQNSLYNEGLMRFINYSINVCKKWCF